MWNRGMSTTFTTVSGEARTDDNTRYVQTALYALWRQTTWKEWRGKHSGWNGSIKEGRILTQKRSNLLRRLAMTAAGRVSHVFRSITVLSEPIPPARIACSSKIWGINGGKEERHSMAWYFGGKSIRKTRTHSIVVFIELYLYFYFVQPTIAHVRTINQRMMPWRKRQIEAHETRQRVETRPPSCDWSHSVSVIVARSLQGKSFSLRFALDGKTSHKVLREFYGNSWSNLSPG